MALCVYVKITNRTNQECVFVLCCLIYIFKLNCYAENAGIQLKISSLIKMVKVFSFYLFDTYIHKLNLLLYREISVPFLCT